MKKLFFIFLALALIIGMTACGGKKGSGSGYNRIGISMPTQSSERWVKEGALMVSELNQLGYDTILQFGEDIVGTQINQIENMLVRGIDVLVVCPIDGGALDSVLSRVRDAGALIIAYDRNLTDTQFVDYYITFDSLDIGNMMGQGVVDGLRERHPNVKPWNVELFAGSLDDSNTIHYFEGGMEKLKPLIDSGDVVVRSGQTNLEQVATLGWAAELAQARMDNILAAYYTGGQVVHGILSPYDGLSIGILSSLRAVGYGSSARPWPAISGQDAEMPSIKSILAGEQYSTILLDLKALARGAILLTDEHMKGVPISVINKPSFYNNGVKFVPAYAIKAMSVTKDNIVREAVRIEHYTEEEMLGN